MCAIVLVLLLVGCGPDSAPYRADQSASPGSVRARTAGAQQTMDRLVAALAAGDRAGWEAEIASADPSFPATAATIRANLTGLGADLDVEVSGRTTELSAERRTTLGEEAWSAAVTLSSVIGDQAPSVHQLWFTFVPDGDRIRWAGTTDVPTAQGPTRTPLWMLQPVEAVRTDHVLGIVGSGAEDHRPWLDEAEESVVAVLELIGSDAVLAETRGVVEVQVPRSQSAAERVLGVEPGNLDHVAGITGAEGAGPADPPYSVVLNPAQVSRLSADGTAVLIAHEATHSLTGAVQGDGPLWLEEGFADLIAFRTRPGTERASVRAVRESVRSDGPPQQLPEIVPGDDPEALGLEYALAWSLCHYLAEERSLADVVALQTAVQSGQDVATALADLGLDEKSLLAGWQRWLVEWSG